MKSIRIFLYIRHHFLHSILKILNRLPMLFNKLFTLLDRKKINMGKKSIYLDSYAIKILLCNNSSFIISRRRRRIIELHRAHVKIVNIPIRSRSILNNIICILLEISFIHRVIINIGCFCINIRDRRING